LAENIAPQEIMTLLSAQFAHGLPRKSEFVKR